MLLEIYLGAPAQSFIFSYGPFGKPELGPRRSSQDIRFSLSHTSEMIVYLFGYEHDVGIDLESVQHHSDYLTGRSAVLSLRERLLIQEAAEEKRAEMFLSFWTRKEACLKALGTGFSMPANAVDVSMAPVVRITDEALQRANVQGATLYVSDFCVREAYRGAIASKTHAIPNVVLRALDD
ncbi:MAG: 4'-phosphopantetheinyl transferase superfamily protein [Thermoleophilia bacterium]|nr:4'-phosphopantetheinyl transferase superfamily protein [Thermoleophilia bacterium]